jgi:hypothetical protein
VEGSGVYLETLRGTRRTAIGIDCVQLRFKRARSEFESNACCSDKLRCLTQYPVIPSGCIYKSFVPLLPLWYSGQSSWLQMQRSRVQFPALPDFLRSSSSETGSTQPREDDWDLLEWKGSGSGLENQNSRPWNPLRWPRDTLYLQKFALTSPTSGGRSVGIVRLRTKATEFVSFNFNSYVYITVLNATVIFCLILLRHVSVSLSGICESC